MFDFSSLSFSRLCRLTIFLFIFELFWSQLFPLFEYSIKHEYRKNGILRLIFYRFIYFIIFFFVINQSINFYNEYSIQLNITKSSETIIKNFHNSDDISIINAYHYAKNNLTQSTLKRSVFKFIENYKLYCFDLFHDENDFYYIGLFIIILLLSETTLLYSVFKRVFYKIRADKVSKFKRDPYGSDYLIQQDK
jgi:hypothetical protein